MFNDSRFRPATSADIVVGKQLWIDGDYGITKCLVCEVLDREDAWKAFVAEDGCRYGLDGLYVAVVDDLLEFVPLGWTYFVSAPFSDNRGNHDGNATMPDGDV